MFKVLRLLNAVMPELVTLLCWILFASKGLDSVFQYYLKVQLEVTLSGWMECLLLFAAVAIETMEHSIINASDAI